MGDTGISHPVLDTTLVWCAIHRDLSNSGQLNWGEDAGTINNKQFLK